MIEVINLIERRMKLIREEFKKKIEGIPFWQLESIFPKNREYSSQDEYVNDILNKYEKENFLYQFLEKDLSILKNNEKQELNIFSISHRFLEGKGYSENQIEELYKFIDEVRILIKKWYSSYFGRRTIQADTRVDAYELKINPNNKRV